MEKIIQENRIKTNNEKKTDHKISFIKNEDKKTEKLDRERLLDMYETDKAENEMLEERLNAAFPETCDWCSRAPVTYTDEAFSLCENCADQMLGY